MRRNRLLAAAAATAATLALLLTGQPGNANPQPADAKITAPRGVVIFAVQSRDANMGTNADAVAIFNSTGSPVSLNTWEIEVQNSAGGTTAQVEFGAINLGAKQHLVVSAADFAPAPIDGQALQQGFDSESTDAIQDIFEIVLTDDLSAEQDRVATVNSGQATSEGDPATDLDNTTDPFNAVIRRDVLGTDTGDNQDDFLRITAAWGTVI